MADEQARLPDAVIDHVYSEELDRWYREFFDREALTDDERGVLEESASDVYHLRATLDQFVARAQKTLGDARGKAIAVQVFGNDFLKIEDYLGIDIPAYIKHLGGDPTLFVKEIPVMEVVRGVLAGIGTSPADPVIAKRLETSITAYLSGIRDALETKDVLMRSVKVGGVGLDAATADRITGALDEKLRALQHAGVILRKGDGKPPEQSTFHLVKPTKTGLMQREDEEEIDRLRGAAPVDTMREQLRSAVDRIVQKTGAKFKSDDVSRRFRTAIEARLRDIRDYQETLDLFTRPSAAGGFGIGVEQAKKVLSVVEDEFRTMHASPRVISSVAREAEPRDLRSAGDFSTRSGSVEMTKKEVAPTTPVLPKPSRAPLLPPPPTPQVVPRQAGGQMPVAVLVHPVPPVSGIRNQESGIKETPKSAPPIVQSPEPSPSRTPVKASASPPPSPPPQSPAPKLTPPPPPPPPAPPTAVPSLGARGGEGELPSARNPSPPPLASRGGAPGEAPPPPSKPQAASPKPPPKADPPMAGQAPLPAPPQGPGLGSQISEVKKIPIAPPPAKLQVPIAPPPKPQAASLKPQAPIALVPPVPPPPSVIREHPSAIRAPSVASAKPKLQDIRPMPARLVGPIEELAQLTVPDFRKIAKTPAEAAGRIVEKLALLEKDSYTKRAEGVKVLRGSPLMGAYVDVVNAALIAKRKMEDEVKDRLTKDRGALTWDEFQALRELNAQIRL